MIKSCVSVNICSQTGMVAVVVQMSQNTHVGRCYHLPAVKRSVPVVVESAMRSEIPKSFHIKIFNKGRSCRLCHSDQWSFSDLYIQLISLLLFKIRFIPKIK